MKFKNLHRYAKDYVDSKIFSLLYKKPKVMNSLETIEYILKNQCSIARYGDGELRLMRNVDLNFQERNSILVKKLKNIKTTNKCLVCIPCVFDKAIFNTTILTDNEYYYWSKFMKHRGGLWNKYFRNNRLLGDAFISRFYARYKDKSAVQDYVNKLKLIWENRNIIFVEGAKSCLGVGNDLFDNAKSIKRILCPATNAYSVYDKIINTINTYAKHGDLIIIALGPTATALSYDLSEKYQCLDLGHVDIEYEWFLRQADGYITIPNKYVNDLNDGRNPESNTNQKYLSQIVARIDE